MESFSLSFEEGLGGEAKRIPTKNSAKVASARELRKTAQNLDQDERHS